MTPSGPDDGDCRLKKVRHWAFQAGDPFLQLSSGLARCASTFPRTLQWQLLADLTPSLLTSEILSFEFSILSNMPTSYIKYKSVCNPSFRLYQLSLHLATRQESFLQILSKLPKPKQTISVKDAGMGNGPHEVKDSTVSKEKCRERESSGSFSDTDTPVKLVETLCLSELQLLH